MPNTDLFEILIKKYAQEEPQDSLDPNSLQVGQSVFDASGKEFQVVENQDGSTTKVLMPKDQQGQPTPQVQTVENADLSSQYKLQAPPGASGATPATKASRKIALKDVCPHCGREIKVDDFYKRLNDHYTIKGGDELCKGSGMLASGKKQAQEFDDEELGIDWEDIQSMAIEVHAQSRRRDIKALLEAMNELFGAVMNHIEVPGDMDLGAMGQMFKGGKKSAGLSLNEHDPFYIVMDPTSENSTIEDVIYKTNMNGLVNFCKGSYGTISGMALYEDESEAMADAESRLKGKAASKLLKEFQ